MATKPLCSIPWRGKSSGNTPKGDTFRFLRDVAFPYSGDDCLIWPYSHNGRGYGKMRYKGKIAAVHRIVCENAHGAPPAADSVASHSCGQGHLGCVNPSHLQWATQKENIADKLAHGTSRRGEKSYASKLTENDVIFIRASAGKIAQSALAQKYQVSKSSISDIQTRRNWAWLP